MGASAKIAFYGSRRQNEHAADVRRLAMNLIMEGAAVAMHHKLYDYLTHDVGLTLPGVERVFDCPADASLAISLGGDGTLLRTVAWLADAEIPVLGVNTGHLGYLTALSLADALAMTSQIVAVDFVAQSLSMLHVEGQDIKGTAYALNEVVVSKEDSSSMISAQTYIDGHYLADYKADGLIVATPTGSTAYNLSVGGPIVQPSAPVWVVSPIAAHSLNLRPIVVSDSSEITITVSGRGERFRLVLDGRASSHPMGSSVKIRRAERTITVLQQKGRDFTKVLGDKLLFNG